jgi:ferredoxin--NADP+ reductase
MGEQTIAIIGAGPASLYAAEVLSKAGKHVVMLNRDVKPGGLAEYGIYPNKYKMKSGLRKMFDKILSDPKVHYFGNVTIGAGGACDLDALKAMGFAAVVVAVGAQGTKWLGVPGEETPGVYHAKDLVYHYNRLPPFSEKDYKIGQNVCVVGLGNVSLDIVHWLVFDRKVARVTTVARRGPAEKAFTDKEMKIVGGTLDLDQLQGEFAAIQANVAAVGQDPAALQAELAAFKTSELECETNSRFGMRFLRGPAAIATDGAGAVTGLVCDVNELVKRDDGSIGVKATGEQETIPCDTVIFAIGDAIEPSLGLPVDAKAKTFATVPETWAAHPDRSRYMVYDPAAGAPMWGTFVMGWARKASDGLVGKARLDAINGCDEVMAWLNGEFAVSPQGGKEPADTVAAVRDRLTQAGVRFVEYEAVKRLVAHEEQHAQAHGLPEYKHASNETMLQICHIGNDALAASGAP